MSTTMVKNLELVEAGSHWVEVNGRGHGGEKEEVFLYFAAQWRGEPVILTMCASRYAHSEGWSEWRVYASDARHGEIVRVDGRNEHHRDHERGGVTDTAQYRLSEEAKPIVYAWLESAAYTASARLAYVECVKRLFRECDRYGTKEVRRLEAMFLMQDKITFNDARRIEAAADAYDTYAAKYKEL